MGACVRALGLPHLNTNAHDIAKAIADLRGIPRPTNSHKWELIDDYYQNDVPLVEGFSKAPRQAKKAKTARRTWNGVDPNSDSFLASFEWRRLRMEVLTERGARCECCGTSPKDGIVIHVDHIKPRRRFPELALTKANLQVLCEVCNHGKGSWDQTDWRPLAPPSEREMDTPVSRSGDGDGQTPVATGAPPDSSVMRPRLIRKTI